MTDQKHTKEPWSCNDDGHIYDSKDNLIAGFAEVYPECAFDIELEDAKRIVECVNACAGIENPLDLRRERDELREALEKIAIIREEDSEKYAVKADQIACEALIKIKESV